jgi:sigma-B regulation protein RsbU (phosphoserine phosphatase)
LDKRGRDTTYLFGFLLGAGTLLFLGRNLLQGSVIVTWGLTFGGTTAVAILGAALYRVRLDLQASRRQLARKEAEISFALEVQSALFPRQMPKRGGLEFAGVCVPAHGIGGDYYDVIRLPDGRLIFAIADISGKGISAAILMANLQALMRTLTESLPSPSEICRKLNDHLHQVTDASKFATFFYAEWAPGDRRLRYVNAGHLSPILAGSCGGQRLDKGGLPLGVFQGSAFEVGEIVLAPGDLLVLYSDGVTEAPSRKGEQFGEQRLQSVIEANRYEPPTEIQKRILDAVRDWSDEPDDDMTLLIARATRESEDIQ